MAPTRRTGPRASDPSGAASVAPARGQGSQGSPPGPRAFRETKGARARTDAAHPRPAVSAARPPGVSRSPVCNPADKFALAVVASRRWRVALPRAPVWPWPWPSPPPFRGCGELAKEVFFFLATCVATRPRSLSGADGASPAPMWPARRAVQRRCSQRSRAFACRPLAQLCSLGCSVQVRPGRPVPAGRQWKWLDADDAGQCREKGTRVPTCSSETPGGPGRGPAFCSLRLAAFQSSSGDPFRF